MATATSTTVTTSGTIQIFVPTKTFRFKNPDVPVETILAQPKSDIVANAYFTTEPGKLQNAPAWIQNDPIYAWAVKDNEIAVVTTQATATTEAQLTAEEQKTRAASEQAKAATNAAKS